MKLARCLTEVEMRSSVGCDAPDGGWSRRFATLLLVALFVLMGCTGADESAADRATSPSAAVVVGPAEVLANYTEAYNAGDIDGMMSVFTDDSQITGHPRGAEVNGLALIEVLLAGSREDAQDDDPYVIQDVQVEGDTVSWNDVWIDSDGQAWCADDHEATIRDGAIVEWNFGSDLRQC